MDIISAVRELCKGEKGFLNMFDKAKSGGKLASLADDARDAELFETLLYGKARNALLEMINDAYNYKEYAVKAPPRATILILLIIPPSIPVFRSMNFS